MKRIYVAAFFAALLACVFLFGCAQSAPSQLASDSPKASSAPSPSTASSASEAPAPPSPSASAAYPVTVTDLGGTEVTIASADRIVSLTPSSTEILVSEGAGSRIVGVDAYSQQIQGAEICGDFNGPDVEKIVSLEPDVVIAGNALQADAIDQLRKLSIPVVSAEATTWDEVSESFLLIGRVIDAVPQADELCAELENAVTQATANKPQVAPTCYFVLSFGTGGNWTSGPGSFINTMIEMAGGTCVTADGAAPWLEYPVEDLVAANPECIIYSSAAGSYDSLLKEPGYRDLPAVTEGRLYEINADVATLPAPSLVQALEAVSNFVNDAADSQADPANQGAQAA